MPGITLLPAKEFNRQKAIFQNSINRYCIENGPGYTGWLDYINQNRPDPEINALIGNRNMLEYMKAFMDMDGNDLDKHAYAVYKDHISKSIDTLKEENKDLFDAVEAVAPGITFTYYEGKTNAHFDVYLDHETKVVLHPSDTQEDVCEAFVKGTAGTEYEDVVTDTVNRINALSRGGVLE